MTLKQAFTIWKSAPKNIALASKSNDAVQRVLMKKFNDIELSVFNESLCRQIFSQSSEPLDIKTKAASVLVYLLQWGSCKGYCDSPQFNYEIAMSKPEPIINNDLSDKTTIDESGELKKEIKMETEKKQRGKQPIPVAQIHPTTLKLIKIWPSRGEAERGIGAQNIDRAVRNKGMVGGFFWCNTEDIENFKPKSTIYQPNTTKVNVKIKSNITDFSDDELISEMKRRGWKGKITMTINID